MGLVHIYLGNWYVSTQTMIMMDFKVISFLSTRVLEVLYGGIYRNSKT